MATMALPLPARRELSREQIYGARYLIAFAVTLASVLELVDTSIVNVAIPHMMGNLGATLDEIAWVSTGYIVANVIVLPLTGWLSVRFGRRNYYTGSIILFTTASFFCGNAHTLESLVAWRIVQGIGGGALISTAQAILFDVFPMSERGVAMAIFGMGVMVGPTLGPTLGGWITDNFDWPWIFYINIPLGIAAAILTWQYVPEPEHTVEQADTIDWWGLAFLILGVGALHVLLERVESKGWFDYTEIKAEAVIAAFGIIAFIVRELMAEHPIVDLRILKNRQLAAGVTFGIALGFALYASVFALPILLQNLLGYTAWDTGRVILPGAIASAITMAFVGRFVTKVDARYMILIGVGLVFWSMWLHYRYTLQIGLGDVFWPMVLRGVGLGFIFVPLTNATVADLHPRQFAQGTGLFNLSRQLGGSFGIAIAATLVTRFTTQAQTALTAHVNAYDPAVAGWIAGATRTFQRLGGSVDHATLQAQALLGRMIQAQAMMIAFERVFLTMGITFVCALPLLLLFRTGKVGGGNAAH